ncbi:MAG: protein-glutamate O-methyltransferase CheR [Candidatus Omnitrophota bacterium]
MSNEVDILQEMLAFYLDRSLSLKFDICTCQKCRKTMMDLLRLKFKPLSLSSDDPNFHKIRRACYKHYSRPIFDAVTCVIETVTKNLPHPVEEDKEKALDNLLEKIRLDRGVDFSQYRRNILKRRIGLRVFARRLNSYADYLRVLASDPAEYEKLFDVLTINISEFFRDPIVWKAIKGTLRNIVQASTLRGAPLVIWSAGCAKGEEPYSLAMLGLELYCVKTLYKVIATDIDKGSLDHAKEGIYAQSRIKSAFENIAQGDLLEDPNKYFIWRENECEVSNDLRDLVEFRYSDLTSNNFVQNTDLIVCRNVFIYFDKPLQERIIDNFYKSLKPGGYLVMGVSERMLPDANKIFKSIDIYNRIYQKVDIK